EVRRRWGGINGIVHAAGVSTPSTFAPIRDLSRSHCGPHFAAKVYGLYNLHRLTREDDLDFRVAFSSLSAILGGLSFAGYAAANAVLDAFAAARPEVCGASWLSIDWDTWKVREGSHGVLGTTVANFEMAPAEGISALQHVIEHGFTGNVINSTGALT